MWAASLGLVIAMVMWGAQVPLISHLSDRFDPYFLAMFRYTAAVPLLFLAVRLTEGGAVYRGMRPRWLLSLGGGMAGFGALYTIGVANSHPVTAAVLSAANPAVAALVAWAVLGTRPGGLLVAALCVVGLGAMLATIDFDRNEPFRLIGGEPLILLAGLCWSWYSIEAQRRLPGASQIRITAAVVSAAALFLCVVYGLASWAGQTRGSPADFTLGDWAAFMELIIGVTVIGVFLWNRGVASLGVVIASMYLNLIPVVAVLVSLGFGYYPRLEQLLGGIVVIAGVVLAQLGPRIMRRLRARPATD